MNRPNLLPSLGLWLLSGFLLAAAPPARALAQMEVIGAPFALDGTTGTGYTSGFSILISSGDSVNLYGNVYEYDQGSALGVQAARWNLNGNAEVLGTLGVDANGVSRGFLYDANSSGFAVGTSTKYVNGVSVGGRAVLWTPSDTAAVELQNLGTDPNGVTDADALSISASGVIGGFAQKHDSSGSFLGQRAVRWDLAGNITELDILGTDLNGVADSLAWGVNDADGTILGHSEKFDSAGNSLGTRPVFWAPGGTAITELAILGTNSDGFTRGQALFKNSSGTIVGELATHDDVGNPADRQPVRWDAEGNITELGHLGLGTDGKSGETLVKLNENGTLFGYIEKHADNGQYLGLRAVRWNADSTAATELETPESSAGGGNSRVYAANEANTAVGDIYIVEDDRFLGVEAALWLDDGSLINLNSLGIALEGGTWTLTAAYRMDGDGWVTGTGLYDPDGSGSIPETQRTWLAQVGLGGRWLDTAGGTWGRGHHWSTGTPAMEIGNATFDIDASYTVGLDRDEATMSLHVTAGEVNFLGNGFGLTMTSGDFTIGSDARVTGVFDLTGNLINDGTLSAGDASPAFLPDDTGVIGIDGDLIQRGELEFDIEGLAGDEYDHFDISGELLAAGIFRVILDGYAPQEGDRFDLADFGSFTDAGYGFDFSQATLDAGLIWNHATFEQDGFVSVSAVPEPSTAAVLAFGMMWIRRRRSRRPAA